MPGLATDTWIDYLRNPVAFVREAFGAEPDKWQGEALQSLAKGRCVAVRSGHGVGKSTDLAWAVLWGLMVGGALIPCTAPTEQQLRDILWPEIARWGQRCPDIWKELEMTEKRIRLKRDPNVFAVARVAKTAEGLAGFHAPWIIYLADEAPGIPETAMAVVDGALTTEHASCFMAGNPTKPTGYFIDAFGKNQDRWDTFTVNGEDCDRVSRQWIKDMGETWGTDSNFYRVRVLGLPPQGEEEAFISYKLVEDAVNREVEPDGPLVIGVDVARYGSDKSAICCRRGWKVFNLVARHGLSNPQVAAWASQVAQDLQQDGERPSIRVDDGGVGGGVTDTLNLMQSEGTLDAEIVPLNFGGAGNRFYGTNAGVWYGFIRQLMQKEMLQLPDDHELRQQLTTRTFATNLKGKIVLEQKDHMRSRGVPSPDKADALALTMAGVTLTDWNDAYGIRTCECGHKFVDREGVLPCPKCGAKPREAVLA